MSRTRVSVLFLALMVCGIEALAQQTPAPAADASPQTTARLLELLKAQDARLKDLEAEVSKLKAAQPSTPGGTPAAAPTAAGVAPVATAPAAAEPPAADAAASPTPPPAAQEPPVAQAADVDMGGHSMAIPGGPVIKFRGFFDFNFGVGSIANPLVF